MSIIYRLDFIYINTYYYSPISENQTLKYDTGAVCLMSHTKLKKPEDN